MTMHTENVIVIDAPPDLVFELAAQIERWPRLLSHYRYVRIHPDHSVETDDGPARVATMSAFRARIPVRWTSTQTVDRRNGRIVYRHIAGLTRGMDVEWKIEPLASGSYVTIVHELKLPQGVLRIDLVRRIAATFFVHGIADRTLRGIRNYAEAQARRQAVR